MDIKRVNPLSEVYSVHNKNKDKKNGKEQRKNNSNKSFKEIFDETKKKTYDNEER